MANKTFNTRVKNKRDTAANWEAVATTFQPLDGELIIVDTAAGKTRFKVGRYDTAKGRLLYYNEIPFTDEYLYNDLNESQGKIYDKLKGIDDKSIIEMTFEPFAGNDAKLWSYRIGLWQFPKTGFYKINLPKTGAKGKLIQMFARITQDDGTTPEDDWATTNLKRMSFNGGDAVVDSIYALAEYADNSAVTAYRVQFLNFFGFPGTVEVNTYNKTTQKWAHLSVARSDADTATKVSNALTLTKGDTTTTFNGSTAQTVSIPTKTSELTNDSNFTTQTDLDNLTNTVVSYNAQENITDEQKAQARTNIGAISSDELVQSDWNQNDETAKDYIKNRICYTQTNEKLMGSSITGWYAATDGGSSPIIQKMIFNNTTYTNLEPTTVNDIDYTYTCGDYSLKFHAAQSENYRYLQITPSYDQDYDAILFYNTENNITQIDNKYIQNNIKNITVFLDFSIVSRINDTNIPLAGHYTVSDDTITGNIFDFVKKGYAVQIIDSNKDKFFNNVGSYGGTTTITEFICVDTESLTIYQISISSDDVLGEIKQILLPSISNNDIHHVLRNPCDVVDTDENQYTGSWSRIVSYNYAINKFLAKNNTAVFTPTADYQPATKKYVDDQITTVNNQLGGLTGAMHFIGKAAVDITDGSTTDPQIANYTTKEKGDVILGKDDHKEFVWNGAIWEELGDEGSYALKTTTINGKALSDNITLTASDVGAASASTIETMQAAIDSKPSAADAVYTATAASTDGVAYTATVSGIDSLTVGASFIMIPNKASTSKAPTLNVNGLGAKPIRRRLSSLTTSLQQGYSTNWIALNKPFTVVYDGTAWVIEGLTKTDGADVYGAVAQATADAKGNNIADTYATIAMLQSLLPKVTTITLTSNWVGDASLYYQDIALSCVTETSIVDLQPTPEQLNSWQDDGIAFTTLSGNGTVRVYVAGGKPSSAISVQVRVQEVTVI